MYLILRMRRKNGIVMEYPMAIMVLPGVTFEELSTVKRC
jgi:hypothetical protein